MIRARSIAAIEHNTTSRYMNESSGTVGGGSVFLLPIISSSERCHLLAAVNWSTFFIKTPDVVWTALTSCILQCSLRDLSSFLKKTTLRLLISCSFLDIEVSLLFLDTTASDRCWLATFVGVRFFMLLPATAWGKVQIKSNSPIWSKFKSFILERLLKKTCNKCTLLTIICPKFTSRLESKFT